MQAPAYPVRRRLTASLLVTVLLLMAVQAVRSGHVVAADNLAAGRPVTASSHTQNYAAANANDGNQATYWESAGNAFPQWIQVDLGSVTVNKLVLKLPTAGWPARTQTISVRGSTDGSAFTEIVASKGYEFGGSGTIDLPATATRFLRLQFTANTGWPAAQLSEFEVYGSGTGGAVNLAVGKPSTASSHTHTYVASNANDNNVGTYWESSSSYPATLTVALGTDADLTSITLRLNPDAVWGRRTQTIEVLGRALDASDFTSLVPSATYTFDPATGNTVTIPLRARVADVRLRYTANSGAPGGQVAEFQIFGTPIVVETADLVAAPVNWSPGNPSSGDDVRFTVAIKNQGTIASTAGSHGITLTISNADGAVVKTLTGSANGAIAAGVTTSPVALGSWTAANGRYTVKVALAEDENELPAKRANNTSTHPLFIGRGASMPYDMYEAEDAAAGGGAAVVGPNRTVGDLAGEASGRRAVTLNPTGSYVEFATRASTNTLVTRFSIPDAAGGGGISSTLDVHVNGAFHKRIDLTSRYAWLYGPEASPTNSPGSGPPRHIYDEANVMLNATFPAGTKIRLQKGLSNSIPYTIDFVNTEEVTPVSNPDPAKYVVPAGFGQQDVQNALDKARMDASFTGVYLPQGDYQTSSKFQVYGKAVKVVGAGPWYTRFFAPSGQENTDIGFRVDASGSSFTNFAYFGNYTSRIDAHGKVFDLSNVSSMVFDNIWTEHQVVMLWGAHVDHMTIKNSRIRNLFADGLNMTNGSTNNLVTNNESRATGDDSFALFAAIDFNSGDQRDNVYEHLTSLLTWRAAGLAVYGGYANTFRDIYIADTLVYPGITISSLDFGIPMKGFGADPPTRFENISLVRAGGHFWGAQTFPAMWLFSASKEFQGIRVSNLDIVSPTYHGIMFQTKYSGGQPENPVKDTIFTNVSISGAQKSGDAYDAKSGFGIWANELPEPDQGPAVGSVIFNGLTFSNNFQNVKNTTSTFNLTINQESR